jgi:hypothetical protein
MEKLESTQSVYWRAIRWDAPDIAASAIRYRNPARKLSLINPLANISVTNYQQISSTRDLEQDTATVQVVFDYIQSDTGKLFKLRDKEVWWFDAKTNRWYLDGDLPNFRQPY